MSRFSKALALFLALTMGLAACASPEASTGSEATQQATEEKAPEAEQEETAAAQSSDTTDAASSSEGKVFKIGIVQFMKHPALDAAREGFIERLDELGIQYEEDYQDAQGDQSNLKTIGQRFVNNNVDLILAIATPAVQSMIEEVGDIPVLGTAVTDYVEVNLVDSNEKPGGNVSGTSDMSPIDQQIKLITEMKPDVETIGIIYTTSEANSKIQVEIAKAEIERLGLKSEETAISAVGDLQQATQALGAKVDAIFVPTDSTIASAIQTLASVTDALKIPVVGGEENQVAGGATATIGLNYKDLGRQTADMAERLLVGGEAIATMPVETAKNFTYSYNKQSVEATGVTMPEHLKNGTEY